MTKMTEREAIINRIERIISVLPVDERIILCGTLVELGYINAHIVKRMEVKLAVAEAEYVKFKE